MKYIGTKQLETDRLILRRLTKEDATEAYNNWCHSDLVDKYVMWSKHKNIDVTKHLFEEWEKSYEDLSTYKWIVQLKESKELIGTIDVVSKKYMPYDACEIGYCYGDKYWNYGYATEALVAVIKFLFEECDAETVYSYYMTNNPASGKVMKKALMTFEGILRGRIIDKNGIRNGLGSYSITKEEYIKNKDILTHQMNLKNLPFKLIDEGTKTIEMRLNDEKRQKIKIGDIIEFNNNNTVKIIKTRVIGLHKFPSFKELYDNFDKISIGYEATDNPNPTDMSIYYKKEDIDKYGVVGIEIEKL